MNKGSKLRVLVFECKDLVLSTGILLRRLGFDYCWVLWRRYDVFSEGRQGSHSHYRSAGNIGKNSSLYGFLKKSAN